MRGKNVLEFGARSDGVNDFTLGMTTSADTDDGGFSSETTGLNPIAQVGVFNSPAAVTNKSTNVAKDIIASCEDPTYTGKNRMLLGASTTSASLGDFYWWDGSTITLKKTSATATFLIGTTDFVPWYESVAGLGFYATTAAGANGDIARWDGNTTLVENWWTSTLGQTALSAVTAWRPLLNYGTWLFIGDANKLHRVDAALAVSNSILTLLVNERISALGTNNNSGKMLIATSTSVDYSATRNGKSFIYEYDGSSNKPLKVCEVNGTITSFANEGDTVYVFYGNKMGVYTGSGIRYLRTLNFSTGTASKLIYPHRRAVIDTTLYIAENNRVVAFGEIIPGRKVFYPALTPDTSSQNISCLANIGGGLLGFAYLTNNFYTHDTNSVATVINGGTTLYSKKYKFKKDVRLKKLIVEFKTPVSTGSAFVGTVYIVDEKGNTTNIKDIRQDSSMTQYTIESGTLDMATKKFQIKYVVAPDTSGLAFGVPRFLIEYDPIE